MAALDAIGQGRDTTLERARQLEFIKTEHGQGQQHEHQGAEAQCPRILQGCAQHQTGQAGGDAQQRISQCHAQRIGERQVEGMQTAEFLAANDDAGQYRNHRQDAGRQRQQQPEAEETDHDQPQFAVLQQRGDAFILVDRHRLCAGRSRLLYCRNLRVAVGIDRKIATYRRVAQAAGTAALIGQAYIERETATLAEPNQGGREVVIDLRQAEGRVLLGHAFRQFDAGQFDAGRQDLELKTLLVQIMPGGNLKIGAQGAAVLRRQFDLECLLRR
jgi:hypothetical protein